MMDVETLKQYAAIIFDWDGTIVDSQPAVYAALLLSI